MRSYNCPTSFTWFDVLRFVKRAASYNAEEDDVTYGITVFADMTEAEAERMYGFNSTNVPELESSEDDEPQEFNPKFNLGSNHQGRYGPAKSQIPTQACWSVGHLLPQLSWRDTPPSSTDDTPPSPSRKSLTALQDPLY